MSRRRHVHSPQQKLFEAEQECQQVIRRRLETCERASDYQREHPEETKTIENLSNSCDRMAVEEKCCLAQQLCYEESTLFCSRDCQDLLYGRRTDPVKRKECARANLTLSHCLNRYFRHVADRSSNYSTFKEKEEEQGEIPGVTIVTNETNKP